MEWRINDEAFVIWLSQRWREMNLLQHNADNGIAYSRFHLFPLYFSCGSTYWKKEKKCISLKAGASNKSFISLIFIYDCSVNILIIGL